MMEANCRPQDQNHPRPNKTRQLDLSKSCSIFGFIIWFDRLVHWISKRQSIAAQSLAEAKIYAVDECTKYILILYYLMEGWNLQQTMIPTGTTPLYNHNNACVTWSNIMCTKGLQYIQIRENAVKESVVNGKISVSFVKGKKNFVDYLQKK